MHWAVSGLELILFGLGWALSGSKMLFLIRLVPNESQWVRQISRPDLVIVLETSVASPV